MTLLRTKINKMKSKITCFFFLITTTTLMAQSVVSSTLLDAKSNAPIPYVNIGVQDSSLGTVSDQDGFFTLEKVPADSRLLFSAIGYESLELDVSAIKNAGIVVMTPKAYEIEVIKVKATAFDGSEKRFGLKNKTRGLSVAYGNPQLGTEMGALIAIDQPTYIKSANFVLNHAKGDSLLLRLKIYNYVNEEIGDHILKENILILEKQRKGVISVDLSEYGLVLENDVLFSLEWLRNFDEQGNRGITFDTKKGKKKRKGVYLKTNSTSEFRKMPYKPRATPCFYFMGKQAE